jgi:hypothetical protein
MVGVSEDDHISPLQRTPVSREAGDEHKVSFLMVRQQALT